MGKKTSKEVLNIIDNYWMKELGVTDFEEYKNKYGSTKIGEIYEYEDLGWNGYFGLHCTLMEYDTDLYLVECSSRGVITSDVSEITNFKSLNEMSDEEIIDAIDGLELV